jgi:hypothetical protein
VKENRIRYFRASRWLIRVIFVPLVFLGCASVSIESVKDPSFESVKDPSFSNPIHRLFIVVNNGQVDTVDPAYTRYLVAALKDEFTRKGVDIEIRATGRLALNDNVDLAEIASYKPDGVLTIIASGGVVGPHGGMVKILYDVSLFDAGKNKRIWRARLDASGGTGVQEKRMKMMAQGLVKRLSEDHMISSEPRSTGQKI